MPRPAQSTRTDVRGVSGWGARCGCGGKSQLHLARGRYVTPETSTFLCTACVEKAVAIYLAAFPQPPYWPGDEGRDESYVAPDQKQAERTDDGQG